MSEIRYIANIIVYEDGHRDVIWDSSISMEDCYMHLKQITEDMEASMGNPPPPPPKNSKNSPKITRLK